VAIECVYNSSLKRAKLKACMPIEEEQLQQFIELYKQEYDIVLTVAQAKEKAIRLFNLYKIIYLRNR
jgi:hypothetical protein